MTLTREQLCQTLNNVVDHGTVDDMEYRTIKDHDAAQRADLASCWLELTTALDANEGLAMENSWLHITNDSLTIKVTEAQATIARLRTVLHDAEILASYDRADGHRDWWSGGAWLHKGEVIVLMDRKVFDDDQETPL